MKISALMTAAFCASIGFLEPFTVVHAAVPPGAEKLIGALVELGGSIEKSATVETLASRATASTTATIYGGFTLSSSATVYILVRGPSLTTLGVTPNALDAPWVRLYNANNADLVTQGSLPGFTTCLSSAASDKPVVDYYQAVRNAPAQSRDSCIAVTLPAGVYTFSITPSIPGVTSPTSFSSVPSSGEILFWVTLGPASADPPNKVNSEKLLGGVWTFLYTIISTFSDQYSFQSVDSSPSASGECFVEGTDAYGGPVAGGYDPNLGMWAVLDPSIIIDKFYTFSFTGTNTIIGCYYQISPPGSTNLSACYPLTGSRAGLASMRAEGKGSPPGDEQRLNEVAKDSASGAVVESVLESYLAHRRQIRQ